MAESAVELTVCHAAEQNGWLVRKIAYPGRRNATDRLFIKGGRVVFVEFKAPGKEPRVGQLREHERFIEHGAELHVIDDIEAGLALFT